MTRGRPCKELTQKQIDDARAMKKRGASVCQIADYLECSWERAKLLVTPGWERTRAHSGRMTMKPIYDPRRDGLPEWRSPGACIMGEPPIGRSALDKRNGA